MQKYKNFLTEQNNVSNIHYLCIRIVTKNFYFHMKKLLSFIIGALITAAPLSAKDIKVLTVKTTPEMHCNGCETKIKNNIRFVNGVKKIDTSLETKLVTITYDADKTNSEKITAAFKKIGYETTTVSDKKAEAPKVDGKTEATGKN